MSFASRILAMYLQDDHMLGFSQIAQSQIGYSNFTIVLVLMILIVVASFLSCTICAKTSQSNAKALIFVNAIWFLLYLIYLSIYAYLYGANFVFLIRASFSNIFMATFIFLPILIHVFIFVTLVIFLSLRISKGISSKTMNQTT